MNTTTEVLALRRVAEAAQDFLEQFESYSAFDHPVYRGDIYEEALTLKNALLDVKPLDNTDVL